eukprot:gene11915-328_t
MGPGGQHLQPCADTPLKEALSLVPFSKDVAVLGSMAPERLAVGRHCGPCPAAGKAAADPHRYHLSYALHCFERSAGATHAATCSCGSRPEWSPGDCDVFFLNTTAQAFHAAADTFVEAAASVGLMAVLTRDTQGVIDFRLARAAAPCPAGPLMSFVRYRGLQGRPVAVADVADSFDIDVCRVAMRRDPSIPGGWAFEMTAAVRDAVCSGTATTYRDLSRRTGLSLKAKARAMKYHARGFTLSQGPPLPFTSLGFTYLADSEASELGGPALAEATPLPGWGFHRNTEGTGQWVQLQPEALQGVPGALQPSAGKVSVITYNCWSDPTALLDRSALLAQVLDQAGADVICLQEATPCLLEHLLQLPWVQDGYFLSAAGAPDGILLPGSEYGQLTLVRRGLWKVHGASGCRFYRLRLPSRMGRWVLLAQLGTGPVVANLHLESGSYNSGVRQEQLGWLVDILEGEDTPFMNCPALICGDFNWAAGAGQEESAIPEWWHDAWTLAVPGAFDGACPGYTIESARVDRMFLAQAQAGTSSLKDANHTLMCCTSARLIGLDDHPCTSNGLPVSDHYGVSFYVGLDPS